MDNMNRPTDRWSWKAEPVLMAQLRSIQNHPAHEHRDILTIVGFFSGREELLRHIASCAAQAQARDGHHPEIHSRFDPPFTERDADQELDLTPVHSTPYRR